VEQLLEEPSATVTEEVEQPSLADSPALCSDNVPGDESPESDEETVSESIETTAEEESGMELPEEEESSPPLRSKRPNTRYSLRESVTPPDRLRSVHVNVRDELP